MKNKLIKDPDIGKKLVGDPSSIYRLRVSDYSVIYKIIKNEILVTVIKI